MSLRSLQETNLMIFYVNVSTLPRNIFLRSRSDSISTPSHLRAYMRTATQRRLVNTLARERYSRQCKCSLLFKVKSSSRLEAGSGREAVAGIPRGHSLAQ